MKRKNKKKVLGQWSVQKKVKKEENELSKLERVKLRWQAVFRKTMVQGVGGEKKIRPGQTGPEEGVGFG